MDTQSFDALVEDVSYWWSDNVPDWIRLMDSDRLRDQPNAVEKQRWLRKSKAESLRRTIQERVNEIAEAWENDDEVLLEVLKEAFPEDLKCYGDNLSLAQQKMWIDRAALAACGRGAEIVANEPVVYFISPDDGTVKIGFTTCLKSRLRSLRTAHPKKLMILLVVPGTREDEQELHRRFSNLRVRGEWFKLDETIRDFIASKRPNYG
jgi:Meiotically up-regulated gene 113